MSRLAKIVAWIGAALGLVLFALGTLWMPADKLAKLLAKRRDAEERARAAADASLAKLNGDVIKANEGIRNDAAANPAGVFNLRR